MKEAVELLGLAGGNNLGLNVDILHLIRNGETPADMIHVDPAIMFYAQLCDGPLRKPEQEQEDEAAANRLVAGQGEFPLVDFVRALPQDAVYSIEAPMSRLHRQLSASNMAKLHIESVRRILSAAGRT
jgi:sugar phosphate isomerase/epimerase